MIAMAKAVRPAPKLAPAKGEASRKALTIKHQKILCSKSLFFFASRKTHKAIILPRNNPEISLPIP
jgi:hypothetical protein